MSWMVGSGRALRFAFSPNGFGLANHPRGVGTDAGADRLVPGIEHVIERETCPLALCNLL